MKTKRRVWFTLLISLALLGTLIVPVEAKGLTGSFYTTSSGCEAGNITQFTVAGDIFLASGNSKTSKLPDSSYYVQVTEPNGVLLGKSTTAIIVVKDGYMTACYKLWDIVSKTSDGTMGFDLTTNPGGVYKVWLSPDADFVQAKTHNFKIINDTSVIEQNDVNNGKLSNNGIGNGRELPGERGWMMRLENAFSQVRGWMSLYIFGRVK